MISRTNTTDGCHTRVPEATRLKKLFADPRKCPLSGFRISLIDNEFPFSQESLA